MATKTTCVGRLDPNVRDQDLRLDTELLHESKSRSLSGAQRPTHWDEESASEVEGDPT